MAGNTASARQGAYKTGIGREKQDCGGKEKKEYVTKNMQLSTPKELVEFLAGEGVKTYMQKGQ